MRRGWIAMTSILLITSAGCGSGGSGSETCTDAVKNQNETDVDCGGVCKGCDIGDGCLIDEDCENDNCQDGTCSPYDHESCIDGRQNQDETDVDCGGETCDPCANGLGCERYTDCVSGFCDNGVCRDGDDQCPDDPDKTEPGQCGCGVADTDTDGDGTADCDDGCADDPDKTEPGQCGCGAADVDSDGDGSLDCDDGCPADPDKTEPGQCGCGMADADSDGDGTLDCDDGCPDDADKTEPGICGCGVVDDPTDTDADGTADCADGCVDDPDKIDPGACGCGVPDVDENGNGSADCLEDCSGEVDGTAEWDRCGRCAGGNTGIEPCPVLTLEPVADAYVASGSPDANYGDEDELRVNRDQEASLMRFDLSALPTGAAVIDARLRAVSFCGHAYGGDGNVYINLITDDDWDEMTVTWATQPAAEADPLAAWWIWYDNCEDAPKEGSASSPALARAVQSEAGTDDLLSVRLSSPGYWTSYYSREHAEAADRPSLEIAYLEPDVLVLEPEADAYVTAGSPVSNYGAEDELRVDRDNAEAFLRFDLSSVPEQAKILAVELRAVSFCGNAYGGDGNVYTHLVTDDAWDEMTVTWDTRPAAEADPIGRWWIWYDNCADAPKIGLNADPALARAVVTEAAGDGLLSVRLHSPGYWTSYYSREHGEAADRPQLIVYYRPTQDIELEPVADAYVSSSTPGTNYGDSEDLEVNPDSEYSFLRFEVAGVVPSDTVFAHATLRAVSNCGHAYGGDGNVYTHLVADDAWDEMGITWDNQPEAAADPIGQWWIWYNNCEDAPKVGAQQAPALGDAVLSEAAGDGLLSVRLHSPGYWTRYYSREVAEPADRPKLILTVYLP